MTRILLRPLRLETWRELAFVLVGGVTAVVGFCVQVAGLAAGLSLLVTLIGIPILAALVYVTGGFVRSTPRSCDNSSPGVGRPASSPRGRSTYSG